MEEQMKKQKEYKKLDDYSMDTLYLVDLSYHKDPTPEWQHIKWEINKK